MNKINMDKIEELAITGTFNQETYQKNYEKYNQERIEIEVEINKCNVQLNENLEQLIKFSFGILYNLSDFWINSDIKTKIEFENLLFPEGLQYEKKGCFRTPVISMILKELQPSNFFIFTK